MSVQISRDKALGLTSGNEILQWERKADETGFSFLTIKPTYRFCKMKFSKLIINKTICLGLDCINI
jgi:hypothetical protein